MGKMNFYKIQRYLTENVYCEYYFADYVNAIKFAESARKLNCCKIRVNSVSARRKKDITALDKLSKQGMFELNRMIIIAGE